MRPFHQLLRTLPVLAAVCMTLAVATRSDGAEPPPQQTVEVDTSRIGFISSNRISVQTCEGCSPVMLNITSETTFRIDKKVVTVADWRAFANKAFGYGADISYRTTDQTAVLVVINSSAALGSQH